MIYYTFINFQPINFTLKSIVKHLQQRKYNKICDFFCLLHGCTYVELNKICFVIFRFFYELLCIYQSI